MTLESSSGCQVRGDDGEEREERLLTKQVRGTKVLRIECRAIRL